MAEKLRLNQQAIVLAVAVVVFAAKVHTQTATSLHLTPTLRTPTYWT